MAEDWIRIPAPPGLGPGPIRLRCPPGTFPPSPASRIALAAVGALAEELSGRGLDWGSGSGLLAIGAARIAAVSGVIGLERDPRQVVAATANARANGVEGKARFLRSDSWAPASAEGRRILDSLVCRADFIVANPPASRGDDGFGLRREVVRRAGAFLREGGRLLLSVSSQYGRERTAELTRVAPELEPGGVAASSGPVPFDLTNPDRRDNLLDYAREEERGGLHYDFRDPRDPERSLTATGARERFLASGESPLTRWQSLLFVRAPTRPPRPRAPG